MQGNVQTALIGIVSKVEHTATYCESVARNAHEPLSSCRQLGASETDLAAEFHCFEKPNRVALIGDDLRLPDDGDRQQAHQKYAERKRDIGVRLSCRETKGANQPSHKDLLVPLVLRSFVHAAKLSVRTSTLEQSQFHRAAIEQGRNSLAKFSIFSRCVKLPGRITEICTADIR